MHKGKKKKRLQTYSERKDAKKGRGETGKRESP